MGRTLSMSNPFTDNPDLVACAQVVEKADPDRFAATMAAPVGARAVLFPIYAMNIEVARAPWVSSEPMIAQMRLQWWRDALDEIDAGGFVRRHEVVTPLALALPKPAIAPLRGLIDARMADVEPVPFDDEQALFAYLDATAGGLAQASALALGAKALPASLPDWARAAGLARYFQAVPDLVARGRHPLPDGRPETLARMACEALAPLSSLRRLRREMGPEAGAAVHEFWQAGDLLRLVVREPSCVGEARLTLPEFRRRAGLLLTGF